MGWLVALIAVVLFGWLLFNSPRFRLAVGLLIAVLAAVIVYWMNSESKSHSLISPEQLVFDGVTLSRDYSWRIAGTIKNNSPHTLTNLKLKVTMRDCRPDGSNCTVIGEDGSVYVFVTVPPSQLRTFDGMVSLSNMPTAQKPTWSYQITETTAQ